MSIQKINPNPTYFHAPSPGSTSTNKPKQKQMMIATQKRHQTQIGSTEPLDEGHAGASGRSVRERSRLRGSGGCVPGQEKWCVGLHPLQAGDVDRTAGDALRPGGEKSRFGMTGASQGEAVQKVLGAQEAVGATGRHATDIAQRCYAATATPAGT
jgi:hypothetical protein